MLPIPSIEQQSAINALCNGNVIIDSVAGSGKTTTIMHMAKSQEDLSFLLLTYNRRLRLESQQRADSLGIYNLDIHTYHSFAFNYYSDACCNDEGLIRTLDAETECLEDIASYDIIILDEAQDMTLQYFRLVARIIKDADIIPRICVIGDKNQCIFKELNDADFRYLTLAEYIFNRFNNFPWSRVEFKTSYRVDARMADFLNQCVLDEKRMVAVKTPQNNIDYIYANPFSNVLGKIIYRHIIDYNVPLDEIFILAPSVKQVSDKGVNTPISLTANYLTQMGVNVFIPSQDGERVDSDVLRNKVSFLTYHQSKGLERKLVFVMGFDDSYFEYYNRSAPQDKCTNQQYVALTRAKKKLVLFHAYGKRPFQFINQAKLKQQVNFVLGHCSGLPRQIKDNYTKKFYSATELLKFIPAKDIIHLRDMLDYRTINRYFFKNSIELNNKVKQDETFEQVSAITAVAVSARIELNIRGKMKIKDDIERFKPHVNEKYYKLYENLDSKYTPKTITKIRTSDLLKLTNIYLAFRSSLMFSLKQITNYSWINKPLLSKLVKRTQEYLSDDAEFEIYVSYNNNGLVFHGYIDCIDQNNVWEFKCKAELQTEDFLQLAIYAFILMKTTNENYNYYLYNIRTDEKHQLVADIQILENFIVDIINCKKTDSIVADEIFIKEQLKY